MAWDFEPAARPAPRLAPPSVRRALIAEDNDINALIMLDAMREDRDAWREQARKEGDERRELAQRLALAAPIATPLQPGVTPEVANQRRPFLKRLKQRLVG